MVTKKGQIVFSPSIFAKSDINCELYHGLNDDILVFDSNYRSLLGNKTTFCRLLLDTSEDEYELKILNEEN